MPDFSHEAFWRAEGFHRIAGIDEAGRGPLAGPVTAAAVILPEGFEHPVLNDSKQLPEKKREALYAELTTDSRVLWASASVGSGEIDRINILRATHLAMALAFGKLKPKPDLALIDGRPVKDFPAEHRAIVKGDSLSLSIAAASIIAKVARDRFMREAEERYPGYGFGKHKGYGTAEHLEALRVLGPCPLHRRSFAPVAQGELDFG
jgi:ribonuclease HII